MATIKKQKKTVKKRIKREVILGAFAFILICYILLNVPNLLSSNKLAKLGYDKEAIVAIEKQGLTKEILDNQWYSQQLNNDIKVAGFRSELLELYLIRENVNAEDILLYDKLSKHYTAEQILALFSKCQFYEMTPLLVFDPVEDINSYISDVEAHHTTNSQEHFVLSNTYITNYKNTELTLNQGTMSMLVNKRYHLSPDYVPTNLVDMSVRYAAKGIKMEAEAYEQFKLMCDAIDLESMKIYASSTYRSYEYQDNLYTSYLKKDGEQKADTYAARPGHSEHQTGLTADLATTNSGMTKFGATPEYTWMLQNAHRYGWILRYPEGKQSITGYEAEPWHWRYVGIDIATQCYNSKLTYDEFYMLYLMP